MKKKFTVNNLKYFFCYHFFPILTGNFNAHLVHVWVSIQPFWKSVLNEKKNYVEWETFKLWNGLKTKFECDETWIIWNHTREHTFKDCVCSSMLSPIHFSIFYFFLLTHLLNVSVMLSLLKYFMFSFMHPIDDFFIIAMLHFFQAS